MLGVPPPFSLSASLLLLVGLFLCVFIFMGKAISWFTLPVPHFQIANSGVLSFSFFPNMLRPLCVFCSSLWFSTAKPLVKTNS